MLFINTDNHTPLGPAGAKLPQIAGGPCHWALFLDADENVTPRVLDEPLLEFDHQRGSTQLRSRSLPCLLC